MLDTVEVETGRTPNGSVIWLHGLGADGHDFEPIVPEFRAIQSTLRFVFPHAPVRPVTINGGLPMRAWYDVPSLARDSEDADGIRASAVSVEALIERELQRGIADDRVMLAGFSQGGAIALHTGLRHRARLAGIVALSTYLPLAHTLADERASANAETPIFLAHGSADPVLPVTMGEHARQQLDQLRYDVSWHRYEGLPHAVSPQEIRDLDLWMAARFD